MVWNGMEDDFSMFNWQFSSIPFPFHTKNHPFHTKIFFIFLSILPYQGKFRLPATRNLDSTFAMLSMPSQVVAREGKQHGKMHLQGRIYGEGH